MVQVMKFGGSAMANGETLANCATILAGRPATVVVVSAMFGVTEQLQRGMELALANEHEIRPLMTELRTRHFECLDRICEGRARDQGAAHALEFALERLERLLYGINFTGELTSRLRALVLAQGERLSAPMMAAAIRAAGGQAVHMEGHVAGVCASGDYLEGDPDLAATQHAAPFALLPQIQGGSHVVVTGYYGHDGPQLKLFGRGGSDLVATLLGAALDAERVTLWKDVSGFLTADPRAIENPQVVESMTLDEAGELAHLGAKILHPRCLEPLLGKPKVALEIKSFKAPNAPGTRIVREAESKRWLSSIARMDDLAVVKIRGPGLTSVRGATTQILDQFRAHDVQILALSTSQSTLAIVIRASRVADVESFLQPAGPVTSVETVDNRSLICAVGPKLGKQAGTAAAILSAVGNANVNVEMVSMGASEFAIDLLVQTDQANAAVQALHNRNLEVA